MEVDTLGKRRDCVVHAFVPLSFIIGQIPFIDRLYGIQGLLEEVPGCGIPLGKNSQAEDA